MPNQRLVFDDNTFFDLEYDYPDREKPGVLVRCFRAVVAGVESPNPTAAHFAYHRAHMQANPAWQTMTSQERADAIKSITSRPVNPENGRGQ